MTTAICEGDCLTVMADMDETSVDAVVTDPPYELGFMGRAWDRSGIAFRPETWAAALRVLKPGGHLVAFGAPKNYHRLACAIEDAGFEMRDTLMWIYGSGFPKSHNLRGEWQGWGTALKPAYEPIILARKPLIGTVAENVLAHGTGALNIDGCRVGDFVNTTPPGTDRYNQANYEHGYRPNAYRRQTGTKSTTETETRATTNSTTCGSCLKPITDDCTPSSMSGEKSGWPQGETRHAPIGRDGEPSANKTYAKNGSTNFAATPGPRGGSPAGRWPANLVHDGSEEVLAAFPNAPGQQRRVGPDHGDKASVNTYGDFGPRENFEPRGDSGSAARFFYCAKAGKSDRAGSKHPTVKPVALMRWLVRMVTPPGGTILDPFAGTGTTGQAAVEEGFNAILIEREAEYLADIHRRLGDPAQPRMI